MIADAVYAAAELTRPERLATDPEIAKAGRIIRRFLSELPGELTVADLRAELEEIDVPELS
jgi:hypothetical protein